MEQINTDESNAWAGVKRCPEKHRLGFNPFLSHLSWDSGFNLSTGRCWQLPRNGTPNGDQFSKRNRSCRTSARENAWLDAAVSR